MTHCNTCKYYPHLFHGRAPLDLYKRSSPLGSDHLIAKPTLETNYSSVRPCSRLRGFLRPKRPPHPSLKMSASSARERRRLLITDPLAPPTRLRTGCWTCRIRKKRCDETANDDGICGECDRLAIKCLGWGEKRPEWCRVRHVSLSRLLLLNSPMTHGTHTSQDKAALNAFKLAIKKQLMSRSANRPSIGPNAIGSPHGGSRRPSQSGTPDVATNAMYQSLLGDFGQSLPVCSRRSLNLTLSTSDSPFGWFATSLTYDSECSPEIIRPDLPMLGYSHPPAVASHPGSPGMLEDTEMPQRLRNIATTSNIPNEFMQYISQIAELAQWKSSQAEQGTLSYRELARRGRAIEDLLLGERRREAFAGFLEGHGDLSGDGPGRGTPLSDFSWSEHSNSDIAFLGDPNVPLTLPHDFFTQPASSQAPAPLMGYPAAGGYMHHPAFGNNPAVGYPTNPADALYPMAQVTPPAMPSPTELIHREACLLFLHTIVSGPNPQVPEIEISVHNLFARFSTLAPNELTPDLGFAACLAGCLALPGEQEFFRSTLARLTAQDLQNEAHLLIDEVVGQRTARQAEVGLQNFPLPQYRET